MHENSRACLFINRKHRKISYETEIEAAAIYKPEALSKFLAYLAGKFRRHIGIVCNEEKHTAGFHAGTADELAAPVIREVLIYRPLVFAVLRHLDVAEAFHADALGILQRAFKKAARLAGTVRNIYGTDCFVLERLKRCTVKNIGYVEYFKRVAQVRFICTVFQH